MELKLINFIQESLTSAKYSRNRYFFHRDKYRVWKYSFEEIYRYSVKFALLLKKNNIGKDDKILIKGSNSPEWVIAFIGVLLSGAIVVPLDIRSSADFDLKVCRKVRAKAVISESHEVCSHFEDLKLLKILFYDIGRINHDEIKNPPLNPGYNSGNLDSGRLAEIVFT